MQSQDDPLLPAPPRAAPDCARNGSLLAFRRLRQDVAAFRRFTAAESTRLRSLAGFEHLDQALLEAALVGRWPDGTALSRTDGFSAPKTPKDMLATNYFGFAGETLPVQVCSDLKVAAEALAADWAHELREVPGALGDPTGRRCPTFAHIRKVNPRDLVTDQPEPTAMLQMLRRGISWGIPYTEGEPAEAADRGLLFMSWQTSLEHQFELLSARWMNRRHGPEGNAGHDLLVGQADVRTCEFPGRDGRTETLAATEHWVLPTGGGYFFGPSLSMLRASATL